MQLNRYYGMRSISSGGSRGLEGTGDTCVELAEDQGKWVTRSRNELDAKGDGYRRGRECRRQHRCAIQIIGYDFFFSHTVTIAHSLQPVQYCTHIRKVPHKVAKRKKHKINLEKRGHTTHPEGMISREHGSLQRLKQTIDKV